MYQTIKASFKVKHKKRINGSVAFSSSNCIYYYYLLFDPKVIRKMLFLKRELCTSDRYGVLHITFKSCSYSNSENPSKDLIAHSFLLSSEEVPL